MVTVIGSLNVDLVAYVSRIPRVGETLVGNRFMQTLGGKGANQAVAIAKLGVAVNMIGCVGHDDRGSELINSLANFGVYVENVSRIHDNTTGVALIQVDSSGNNSIVIVPGANAVLSDDHVNASIKAIEEASIVVAQLEVPAQTVKYALSIAKSLGKTTVLNPAPADMFSDCLIPYTDILVPNEIELESISGVRIEGNKDVVIAAQVLLDNGVRDLIVTLGEKGCIHFNKRGSKVYNGRKVTAVDTTAAGDSFVGTLAAILSEGKEIDKAINYAINASALTVTKKGAQASLPTRSDVDNFAVKE